MRRLLLRPTSLFVLWASFAVAAGSSTVAVLCLAEPARAVTVTLVPGSNTELSANASDGTTSAIDFSLPTVLPFADTNLAVLGGSSSMSTYDLSDSGFRITFDHARSAALFASAYSAGRIEFRVDAPVEYVASGAYAAQDPGGLTVSLFMDLYDFTGNTRAFLFEARQTSDATVDESFVLGESGGDAHNLNRGLLRGALLPGRTYLLEYGAVIQAFPPPLAAATATGFLRLDFVPEPSTGVLMALGVVALGVVRRGRAVG